MSAKRAIIIGSEGQDGVLMNEFLTDKQYDIHKIHRNNFDILNKKSVINLVKSVKPHEIYFFAASHKSSQDKTCNFSDDLYKSIHINSFSPIYFLDAILDHSKNTRFFYASSSLIFSPSNKLINEGSSPNPKDPYGISKYITMQSIKSYRDKGIFASSGILSNHESKYRKNTFLSKKIILKAVDAYFGNTEKLVIGDINSYVDWGYAPDFIQIIHKVINHSIPGDFVIASGKLHQVRDFLKIAFSEVNLNYQNYVSEDNTLLKRSNGRREFNISKLKNAFDLDFMMNFEEMIKELIKQEIKSR
jgi:GDPmannose 4,6-dehydratase